MASQEKPTGKGAEPQPSYSRDDLAEFLSELKDDSATLSNPNRPDPGVPIRVQTAPSATTAKVITTRRLTEAEAEPAEEPPKSTAEAHDLNALERSRPRSPWIWIIGGVIVLAAVAVAGFFFFNRTNRFSGTNVKMNLIAPATVASGETVTIRVQYQNKEPADLTHAEITIEYPDGFTVTKTSVTPLEGAAKNAFSIGTVKSGHAGEIQITGTVTGAVNAQLHFSSLLTYTPSTFNSSFQATASGSLTINTSILSLKLDGPTSLAPGASGTWNITYTNTADRDLSNVQIAADIPDGLSVTTATPKADDRGSIWNIPTLGQGKTGSISLTGTVSGNVGDNVQLVVRSGLRSLATNTVDTQGQQTLLILLVNTKVVVSVAVNGSTDSIIAKPGDTLNYVLNVSNSSDVEVTNATVTMALTGGAVDMAQLQNTEKATVAATTLTWTKDQVAGLATIKPNQSVTLHASIGVKKPLVVAVDADRNAHIVATVAVSSPTLSSTTGGKPVVSDTKIATVATLVAESRFFDEAGQQLGSGPLPPAVGKTTTFRIRWKVSNSTNDISTVVVTTTLPTGVFWTGQHVSRDAGDISFDPTSRVVRWTINLLPAGTGARLPVVTTNFDVAITPTADQIGSVVVLTDTTALAATDAFTNQPIAITSPSVTSATPTDATAAGQGTVVAGS